MSSRNRSDKDSEPSRKRPKMDGVDGSDGNSDSPSSSGSRYPWGHPADHPNIHRSVSKPNVETGPHDSLVCTLLTDFYQVTMCYAYWKANKMNQHSVFDLFFRKNPFKGEYTIFAGLEDVLRFVSTFKFTDEDISYLQSVMGEETDPEFFVYLKNLTTKDVSIYAIDEGSAVFPRVPLLRIEGPLAVVQLLETPLLTLVNFASLVATNAARFRVAAGPKAKLLEFGLRRAQGPNGGVTASKYCYIGGFDATSNVLAGKLFGIPIAGTHAHSFVSSFESFKDLKHRTLVHADKSQVCEDFVEKVLEKQRVLASVWPTSPAKCDLDTAEKELAAFTAYALAFPSNFLALIDTYDTVQSGCPNFIIVSLALIDLGYTPKGLRLDSGDLAYYSLVCRSIIDYVANKLKIPALGKSTIVASNDINEDTLNSLSSQGHAIDAYGVGTHLVTCQAQPALGAVYKLVEVDGRPCMKLSAEVTKVSIPGKKIAYRMYNDEDIPILDLLQSNKADPPVSGQRMLCRHPFSEQKRAYVTPNRVEPLHKLYFDKGKVVADMPSLTEIRERVKTTMSKLRSDHTRALNPTPYKVSVTNQLYEFLHSMWLQNAPIAELK